MHTRRLATFLLGAWLGCSLLILLITLQNRSSDTRTDALQERTRQILDQWEIVEIPLAMVLGVCLIFATERRLLPPLMCLGMLGTVVLEHFAIGSRRGAALDPPYLGAEVAKLLLGGILASSLFVMRSKQRNRRQTDRA